MLEDCLYAISGREMTTVQPARIYQALSSICLCSPQFCFPAKYVSILNLKLTNNIIIVILSYSIWEQKRESCNFYVFRGKTRFEGKLSPFWEWRWVCDSVQFTNVIFACLFISPIWIWDKLWRINLLNGRSQFFLFGYMLYFKMSIIQISLLPPPPTKDHINFYGSLMPLNAI